MPAIEPSAVASSEAPAPAAGGWRVTIEAFQSRFVPWPAPPDDLRLAASLREEAAPPAGEAAAPPEVGAPPEAAAPPLR